MTDINKCEALIRRYADLRVMASRGSAIREEVTQAWFDVLAAIAAAPTAPLDREAISNAALDSVLEIVQHARDNICAGGLAENRQHEESVVHPYLDGICDEIDSLKSQPAQHPDDAAVDAFAAAMKAKLAKKRAEGYGGWNTSECTQEMLSAMLRNHVSKGDPVDVGNLAMMLHQRGEGIQPAQPSDSQTKIPEDDDDLPVGYADWYNHHFARPTVDMHRFADCEEAWRAAYKAAMQTQPSDIQAEPSDTEILNWIFERAESTNGKTIRENIIDEMRSEQEKS